MATTIDIRELPARIKEVVPLAAAGGDVVLLDNSIPRVRLVSIGATRSRVPGLHAGAMQATPDFGAPLPDEFWAEQSKHCCWIRKRSFGGKAVPQSCRQPHRSPSATRTTKSG